MDEIAKTKSEYKKEFTSTKCSWCGKNGLDKRRVKSYPHESGWLVKGEKHRQWLYVICKKCGYEWSFNHLGVTRYVI